MLLRCLPFGQIAYIGLKPNLTLVYSEIPEKRVRKVIYIKSWGSMYSKIIALKLFKL